MLMFAKEEHVSGVVVFRVVDRVAVVVSVLLTTGRFVTGLISGRRGRDSREVDIGVDDAQHQTRGR